MFEKNPQDTSQRSFGNLCPYSQKAPCVPFFVLCLVGVETEGLLDYEGRAGIISIVRWNLRPVMFGVV